MASNASRRQTNAATHFRTGGTNVVLNNAICAWYWINVVGLAQVQTSSMHDVYEVTLDDNNASLD